MVIDCKNDNCVVGCISGELIRKLEWKEKDRFHKNCLSAISMTFGSSIHISNYFAFHYCPQCGRKIDIEKLIGDV